MIAFPTKKTKKTRKGFQCFLGDLDFNFVRDWKTTIARWSSPLCAHYQARIMPFVSAALTAFAQTLVVRICRRKLEEISHSMRICQIHCALAFVLFFFLIWSCNSGGKKRETVVRKVLLEAPAEKATAAFASGCFWCTEHIYEAIPGVDSVVSGYAGGTTPNPTYELVNTETTGHAETVLVYYDPAAVSFEELTRIFFLSHDPTTRDRQGPDVGSSYRSILFYQSDEEREIAERTLDSFKSSFDDSIVTEVKALTDFYRAEGYHQDYIHHNPNAPYVVRVSIPRFEKFKEVYKGNLRPGY